ncbi:MAG: damage-inducible protein DinB [Gemmatimonadales bacterium]|nr:MAG: damage-inducible protein DinB [Gemmatimonadales bacterium]
MSEQSVPVNSETERPFISVPALREHWRGHRRLTRRVIEVFPEHDLFRFRIGGLRTFGKMACEILTVSASMARGVASGRWDDLDRLGEGPVTKAELLAAWDRTDSEIERLWDQITPERLDEVDLAFGRYPGRTRDHLLYALDNEVHHRAQGSVYLRAMGVEPPRFWER